MLSDVAFQFHALKHVLRTSAFVEWNVWKIYRLTPEIVGQAVLDHGPGYKVFCVIRTAAERLLEKQFLNKIELFPLVERVAAANEHFAIVIVTEIDVADVRKNPSSTNLKQFKVVHRRRTLPLKCLRVPS